MKHDITSSLAVALLTLVSGCGSNTPDGTGTRIGKGLCDCREAKQTEALRAMKDMHAMLKAKKFSRQTEAGRKMTEMVNEFERRAKECEDRLDREDDELLASFLRDDDRQLYINAKRVVVNRCAAEQEGMAQRMRLEFAELRTEMEHLLEALPH